MKLAFADLWRWDGTISRGAYALVGLVGFALKHNLDRILATAVFHRPWDLFNYWIPLNQAIRVTSLSRKDSTFLTAMLVLALPFIWVGVVLTIRRLRDAALPAWLVVLFFAPFLNLLFFALLCILPSRESDPASARRRSAEKSVLCRLIPQGKLGSAAFAVFVTALFAVPAVVLGTRYLGSYGWGVFVALPFCHGMIAAMLYGYHEPRTLNGCVLVALLSGALMAAALLAFAVEGVLCIAMSVPLAAILLAMGACVGYLFQRRPQHSADAPALLSLILLLLPLFMGVEHFAPQAPPIYAVKTSIEVNAPPEAVWKQVVAFSEIPPPKEWLFRAGIAYPIRAEIFGRGPGAERHCEFSTGAFVEPIQVWDEPRLLKFSVTANPAPMQEWTPYSHLDAPHLHNFLVSSGGQVLLMALPNGRTRLEGTTWYRHSLWPAAYWRLWSDYIIHQIHLRVLHHIAALAEQPGVEN